MKYFYLILLTLIAWALGVESSDYIKLSEDNSSGWIWFFGLMTIIWIIVLGAIIND